QSHEPQPALRPSPAPAPGSARRSGEPGPGRRPASHTSCEQDRSRVTSVGGPSVSRDFSDWADVIPAEVRIQPSLVARGSKHRPRSSLAVLFRVMLTLRGYQPGLLFWAVGVLGLTAPVRPVRG